MRIGMKKGKKKGTKKIIKDENKLKKEGIRRGKTLKEEKVR